MIDRVVQGCALTVLGVLVLAVMLTSCRCVVLLSKQLACSSTSGCFTLRAIAGQRYAFQVQSVYYEMGDFRLQLRFGTAPPNDMFSNRTVIVGDLFDVQGSSFAATHESGARYCCRCRCRCRCFSSSCCRCLRSSCIVCKMTCMCCCCSCKLLLLLLPLLLSSSLLLPLLLLLVLVL
jgi:hypothetical protein